MKICQNAAQKKGILLLMWRFRVLYEAG